MTDYEVSLKLREEGLVPGAVKSMVENAFPRSEDVEVVEIESTED